MTAAEREELVDGLGTFQNGALNDFLALGPPQWTVVAQQAAQLPDRLCVPLDEVEPVLPFRVADYVDFYSSEHHAANVGRIFRPGQPPILPNWRHLPVGYHGRAGTVVVSGTPIVRPSGQRGPGDVGPSQRLDIEAELGFVVGVPSQLGKPVPTGDLTSHVFGVVLVNDWSARDLQSWEYQPLGPFLGKSFATSVSPWIVPLSELARVPAPEQDPPVAEYLDPRAAAGPPDRQRRQRAHRRPVRLRHHLRPATRPGRLVPGADRGRAGTGRAVRQRYPGVPRRRGQRHDPRPGRRGERRGGRPWRGGR